VPRLNDSVSFPNTKTPGAGKTFEDFFEFTLPTAEYITASMSISSPSMVQIPAGEGTLTLSTWTSGVSPSIPLGSVIEQVVSAPSLGGQTAVVGTFTPFGDYELAGTYFVEVAGTSGAGSLKLAVDGHVTTLAAVPEPSTRAMLGIGFAGGVSISSASSPRHSASTQPRCQVATVLESLALADRRDQRRGNCRADARDGRQSTSVLILFRPANELGVKGGDPSIEFGPLGARVGDQRDHPRAQSRPALLIHQHGQELLKLPLALGHNDSALQKDRAQLID
jgi:hypothetical protein